MRNAANMLYQPGQYVRNSVGLYLDDLVCQNANNAVLMYNIDTTNTC